MNQGQLISHSSKSIAVLPFVNMSSDSDNEYFSDGITEEIINALTTINGLKVIARTSSFAYKNKNEDVRIIGQQLGVSTVLEGSVRRVKNRVRITAQLIETNEGTHLWSQNYDRDLEDIFVVQEEISLLIADLIRQNFGHFEIQEHLIEQPTNNIDAYQLFLKGRSYQLKWTPESITKATTYYNQAIVLDKNYAKAYYANLQCYGLLAMWGYMPYEEAMSLAISNLLMAKQIDTTLPEYPLSFVGKFFWEEWDFKNAYIHINKVLDINPNHIDGLEAMTELFIALGFFDKALVYANKLLKVDPLSSNNHYTLANIYYYQRQFDKALEHVNYALTLNSGFELAHHLKCFCLIWLNKEQEFEEFTRNTTLLEEKKLLFGLVNNKNIEVPSQSIERWSKLGNHETLIVPYDVFILSQSRDKTLAFSCLSNMVKQRRGQIINYRNEPFLQPLHNVSGYTELHQSNFSLSDTDITTELKDKSIILDEHQIEILKAELLKYFEEEEPFLNPQLNLKIIADILGLNSNKMSFLINKAFHLNFNDFVNLYRLDYFKIIALDPENAHITILGLAFDSGFNSKAVFNTFFKKMEKMTPSSWLKISKEQLNK